MKRRLGIQGPDVLARPRRAPGVLSPIESDRDGARRSADHQSVARLQREIAAARADLADALDGWSAADPEASARIDAIRRRHGLADSDLTAGSGKS